MKSLEEIKFDVGLEYHLRYNVYPSMIVMFDMCKDAISKVNQGEGDAEVSPPDSIVFENGELTADAVVEMFNLYFFLDEDALDPD